MPAVCRPLPACPPRIGAPRPGRLPVAGHARWVPALRLPTLLPLLWPLLLAAPAAAAAPACCRWSGSALLQVDHARFAGVYSRDGDAAGVTWLRRAEFAAQLQWARDWRAAASVSIDGEGRARLGSAHLGWAPTPGWLLRAGRVDPDFGLEPSTGAGRLFGLERSAIWDLAPDAASVREGLGLRVDGHGRGWHASAGAYDKGDHGALVARAVWLPALGTGRVLQLGGSLARAGARAEAQRPRTRLGLRGVSEHDAGHRPRLARARAPADGWQAEALWALEAAWQHGPATLQAEALGRQQDAAGASDRDSHGLTLLAAWTLHGGARRHDPRRARFGSPGAGGDWGHWEVYTRTDMLAVRGGYGARVQTLGLAWSDARVWRVAFEMLAAQADDANRAGDHAGRALALRVQAAF
jgi:phosphate-selective porin OprO/OprP